MTSLIGNKLGGGKRNLVPTNSTNVNQNNSKTGARSKILGSAGQVVRFDSKAETAQIINPTYETLESATTSYMAGTFHSFILFLT
jgi:hypothetical protein